MSAPATSGDAAEVAEIAQNLARRCGYAVFPVLETKRPATPHGFHDASKKPDGIAELWRQHPAPLIGVVTGEASGIDVLDVDVKHDAARAWLLAAKDRIPATRTYQSRSGGFHILFRHRPGVRNTESHIAKGVDTRGEGGYAVSWFAAGFPCTDHSPVAGWPDWLLEALFYNPEPAAIPVRTQQFRSAGTSADDLIAATIRRLESAHDGGRHAALRGAACTLGGVLTASGMATSRATRLLLDAVIQAGGARVDQRNALATIEWGLTKGAKNPLDLGRR